MEWDLYLHCYFVTCSIVPPCKYCATTQVTLTVAIRNSPLHDSTTGDAVVLHQPWNMISLCTVAPLADGNYVHKGWASLSVVLHVPANLGPPSLLGALATKQGTLRVAFAPVFGHLLPQRDPSSTCWVGCGLRDVVDGRLTMRVQRLDVAVVFSYPNFLTMPEDHAEFIHRFCLRARVVR